MKIELFQSQLLPDLFLVICQQAQTIDRRRLPAIMKILPGFLSSKCSLNPFRSNRSVQSLQQQQQQQKQSCQNPEENESQISCQERSDDVPHRPTLAPVVHIPVDEPLGVEKNLEKIRNLLSDPEVSLIGIAGAGGVGKTTLLKALNNSFLEQRPDFDVVIFASAFYDGERSLQAAMARRLGLPWEESRSKMANAARISVALERRRFLLLLDDIINPVDLEELGVPPKAPRSKSKVVVAARLEHDCKKMGVLPEHVIKVGPMEPCKAWQLFLRHAGTEAPQPYKMDIAERVAGECGGFPLGLRAAGHAMSTARTTDEWVRSLEALKRSKDELGREGKAQETLPPGIEPVVLSTLKFCYNKLSSEKLRDGISYCALFPKNHSIRKDDLICYWIGEGFLEGAHNEGESLINQLKSFGMLKEGANPEQEVAMDDILRDLILQMKKAEFIAEAGTGLTGIQSSHHFEAAKKVSLMHNDITEIEQLSRPSEFATLNLRSNNRLRKLPDDFFRMTPYLRLLDLSDTGTREIPKGISRLAFLRHLDLSFTKIKSLTEEIGELGSLVQLILEGTTSLATIPPGIFPKLTKMAKLNLYRSYSGWELKDGKDVAGENEGPSFNELKYLEQLTDLGITIGSTASWEDFASCEKLTGSATRLMVKDCGDMRSMHLSTKFKMLKEANFSDCSFLKELKFGSGAADDGGEEAEGSNWTLSHLEVLRLKALYKASITWAGVLTRECLPLLREVEISFCHELKDVTWVLQLERVERVILDTCKKIEQVINIEHTTMSIRPCGLPRLRTLAIRNLPKLTSLWKLPLSLSELEYVKVLRCPQLRSLPRSGTGENTTVIYGEKEWWQALEWKNGTEDCSSWYFRATE